MLSSGYYLVWGCQRQRLRRTVRGSGLKSLSPWCPMKSCRIINMGRAEFLFCPVTSAPLPSLHWWRSHIWVFLFPLHCLINSHKHELNCVCGGLAGSDSCWGTSCVAFGRYGVPAGLFPDFSNTLVLTVNIFPYFVEPKSNWNRWLVSLTHTPAWEIIHDPLKSVWEWTSI